MVGSKLKLLYTEKVMGGAGGGGRRGILPSIFFREFFSHALVSERLEKARTSGLVSLVFSRQTGFPVLASVYCYIDVHN